MDRASSGAEIDEEMTPFDKPSDDFLDAPFSYAIRGGKMGNFRPSTAFLFINEIGEHIGNKEGKWCQLRVGAHVAEPNKFLARKDTLVGSHRRRIRMSLR